MIDSVTQVRIQDKELELQREKLIEFLKEKKWEHGWYSYSYDKGELQQQGIPGDSNYEGLAKWCKCYKCRTNYWRKYTIILNETEINEL